MTNTRKRAEEGAIQRLLESSPKAHTYLRDASSSYTRFCEQNLVPGVHSGDFWEDLSQGDGNELFDSDRGPAKFCAAFSSSALAVNTFAPFRHHPERLSLFATNAFRETRFEHKLPTGLKGNSPNLDFVAMSENRTTCIESKFLEPLTPKEAKFADSYAGAIDTLAESSWAEVYALLKKEPKYYQHLDAAQLVKHYLGMRHSLKDTTGKLQLLYLYWEPVNAAEIEAFSLHREEALDFTRRVAGSEIEFTSLSYPQLWSDWEKSGEWEGMPAHIENLRQRYLYAI